MRPEMSTTEQSGRAYYYVHRECDGLVMFDLSGGFCVRCHAEDLDADDIEQRGVPEVPASGPALACPGCGSPDVDLERGLLCGTCAAATRTGSDR